MAELVYLDDVKRDPASVVTVGTFDGVHKGHRVLMETVLKKAKKRDARSVIVTFDPHPRDIISPGEKGIKLLTTLQERREILEDIGIDRMVVIPFDRDFSLLSSEEFVEDIIYQKIGVGEFVIGYDHHFGRNREGTIETIENLGSELGFDAYVVSKQEVGDKTVSSTVIRNAINGDGDIELATELLGRYYMLNGTVVHGDKRGKEIGYPTANIMPEHPNKIIPKDGVYAVKVRVDGQWFNGMMNIGTRPTFEGEDKRTLEVNLFDFDDEIYGKSLQVRFVKRIRDERKFSGVDELVEQLREDEKQSLRILKNA
ncbi:bifunctional riboflavin kinase/FAD synthetase [Aliifodinibius sp. S!AR15-10]|uniref:bifunctional riboflavin kinase/FAD synthetase n=1 Tax=Aliifodinibius sp. S!AR15-10 TaxID=2950437 RepID=UPI002866B0C1|nr:bifunctional riboflavin kinase/FAD synthetase [Aliifodinibius sp. S!AR15-10]MDR8391548.1 bifunctional riboflavin kinase/FAD synthetase [Aliifodinibius sp. S!AR15-10]